MSLITDTGLMQRIVQGPGKSSAGDELLIHPYDEQCLTPLGYDLRIGRWFSSSTRGGPFVIDESHPLSIMPGETVLVQTLENVGMPTDRSISALILSKVSIVSQGVSNISTTIDPDWEGELLIAITNHSTVSVDIPFCHSFCTAVFFENVSASTRWSGHDRGRIRLFLERMAATAHREKMAIADKARKNKKVRVLEITSPTAIILLMGAVGYLIFGNNPGFIAMVAAGAAISQAVVAVIRTRL